MTNMKQDSGIVDIHGKQYKTVALRVNEFRETFADWSIETEIIDAGDVMVIMKATVKNEEGRIIGTGFAEEDRTKGNINRTSALENCETSCIGRALACIGLAGTEYASANEVENAIAQQKNLDSPERGQVSGKPIDMERVNAASDYFKLTIDADIEEEERTEKLKNAHRRLSNDELLKVNELLGDKAPDTNKMYRTILKSYVTGA